MKHIIKANVRQTELNTLKSAIGFSEDTQTIPKVEIVKSEKSQGLTKESLKIVLFNNCFVDGVCYYPESKEKIPAIFYLAGTNNSINALERAGWLSEFALKGYYVFTMNNTYMEPGRSGGFSAKLLSSIDNIGFKVWGKILQELQLGLNYLCTRQVVTKDKIAIIGGSQGGLEVQLLTAFDSRIKCAVVVVGLTSWDTAFKTDYWKIFSFGTKTAQLIEKGASAGEVRDYCNKENPGFEYIDSVHLLPFILPRGLVIVSGEKDPMWPIESAREIAVQIKQLYKKSGHTANFAFIELKGAGHDFNQEGRDFVREKLKIILK
jgi:dienelactone hydrolase